ncbi:hypothetical protein DUNSADRAFT_2910 [Dunaliella salina]|uniref:Secreted protein n=1 Tax=Dunaliella salina TaxID=3046 RepID=A0ABQ7FW31_DUNSA|nr:hypothetical protein DUNSADRAFT_2910 [Dunaliella salina]|eukprot:KAF5826496.1 hypothetical protein DUNSADRAFT_2910 [Dunaliella salina]
MALHALACVIAHPVHAFHTVGGACTVLGGGLLGMAGLRTSAGGSVGPPSSVEMKHHFLKSKLLKLRPR